MSYNEVKIIQTQFSGVIVYLNNTKVETIRPFMSTINSYFWDSPHLDVHNARQTRIVDS